MVITIRNWDNDNAAVTDEEVQAEHECLTREFKAHLERAGWTVKTSSDIGDAGLAQSEVVVEPDLEQGSPWIVFRAPKLFRQLPWWKRILRRLWPSRFGMQIIGLEDLPPDARIDDGAP